MAFVLVVAAAALVVLLVTAVRLRARVRALNLVMLRHRIALDNLPAGLVVLDRSLRTELAAGRGLDGFGLDPSTLPGRRLLETLPPDVATILDPALRAALEGAPARLQVPSHGRDHSLHVVPVRGTGEGVAGVIITLQDVTERRRRERGLSELASRDSLTGLWNRRALERELDRLLDAPRPEPGVILLVDLDGFKLVNDRLGHESGDELLRRVARALESCTRRTDLVARLGGDEFAVLLPGAARDDAGPAAVKISAAVRSVWPPGLSGGASVGVGVLGAGATSPTAVLAAADREMYALKRSRRLARAS
jgi:diguanylate cyclase (GGDEF)-like protein